MPKSPITVKKSGPGLRKIQQDMERIRNTDVLVGIPASETQREGEPINNASLMYIQTHGSELNNIPPRPVIEPAVEQNRQLIAPELAAAAKSVAENRPADAERALARAGTIAMNAAKRRFGSSELAPNAPSTIKRKGSDKPLIDEGLLRKAVTYVLRLVGHEPKQASGK